MGCANSQLPLHTCAVVHGCLSFICLWHSGEALAELNCCNISLLLSGGEMPGEGQISLFCTIKGSSGIEIPKKTSPSPGSCLGQLHCRNSRHVLSSGVHSQGLSAALRGALSVSFGQESSDSQE